MRWIEAKENKKNRLEIDRREIGNCRIKEGLKNG